MIKKIFFALFLIFCSIQATFSDTMQTGSVTTTVQPAQVQPKPVEYSSCIRYYQMPYAQLFQRTLSAISSSNYKIIEIQSRNSRVLFSAGNREFWAGVTQHNATSSSLRILPADSNYIFKTELIDKIFNEIELHKASQIIKVQK